MFLLLYAISRYGLNADALTKEILKDAGYGDIASDDEIVRQVKETIGAIPIDLDRAIEWAKRNPERARAKIRLYESAVGGEIDLARYSWKRFLIGEFIFNPEHEIFHATTGEDSRNRGRPASETRSSMGACRWTRQ